MLLSNVFFSLLSWADSQKRKGGERIRSLFGRYYSAHGSFGIVDDWNDYELGSRSIREGRHFGGWTDAR